MRSLRFFLLCCIVLLPALPSSGYADPIKKYQSVTERLLRDLGDLQKKARDEHDSEKDRQCKAAIVIVSLFSSFLDEIQAEQADQKALKGSISAGFNGDAADAQPGGSTTLDPRTVYKLQTQAEVGRGDFPNEVRFRAETNIRLEKDDISEDVTKLLLNFDYHRTRWLEVYAFTERFSDDYLSIQQRYEIGGGTKIEGQFGQTLTEKQEKRRMRLDAFNLDALKDAVPDYFEPIPLNDAISAAYTFVQKMYPVLNDGRFAVFSQQPQSTVEEEIARQVVETRNQKELILNVVRLLTAGDDKKYSRNLSDNFKEEDYRIELEKIIKDMAPTVSTASRKRSSRFQFGLAGSFFLELEKPHIKGTVDGADIEANLPATHRFRYTVRPSLLFRTQHGEFHALWYFKLPLGDQKQTFFLDGAEEERFDYRFEALHEFQFDLAKNDEDQYKVSLVLGIDYLFDNVPPQTTVDSVNGSELVTARNSHWLYRLMIKFAI